jgi:4-hydroxythreonine-4-phosphate dehydrogenase
VTTEQHTAPRPRVAVTFGDPAGVGPELIAKLLAQTSTCEVADVLLVSDETEIADAGADAGLPIEFVTEPTPGKPLLHRTRGTRPDGGFVRKAATAEGGRWALDALATALDLANAGEVDAILFASLNKSSLHLAGMTENDELHWFEKVLGADGFTCEVNVIPGLMTSRVSSHVSIAEVDPLITVERVEGATRLLHSMLKGSGLESPKIAVCALNPHAGENGSFGRHEIDVIAPTVERLRADGLEVSGPFPSDTIFLRARTDEFDGVVTMYHDQGQIAMKLIGFDRGVTIAGGLRVPICTPAHGSAFDIVGQGIANLGATQHAFDLAVSIGAQVRAAR